MKDFEFDESAVEKKPGSFSVQVDESVLEFNEKTLVPQSKDPMDLMGAVLIPCSAENVVVARNYAEESFRFNQSAYESHNREEEEIVSSLALHKFAELCVSDFLNSKGVTSSVDLKVYRIDSKEPEASTVKTQKGFTFHVKAADVTTSRRTNGPAFLVSSTDPIHEYEPRHYLLGCLVSSDWKKAALLFCIEAIDTRTHLRSPIKFLIKKRCVYHVTTRALPHDDRWGCLRTLVKDRIEKVEVTDDENLSVES